MVMVVSVVMVFDFKISGSIMFQGFLRSRNAIKNANEVREIVDNGQVVLYNDDKVA